MSKKFKISVENILNSAKSEFLKKGFEKSSMRVIAKNAGVTTGALYTRFKSKDEIFCIIVQDFANNLIDIINKEWSKLNSIYLDTKNIENFSECIWIDIEKYRKITINSIFENYDIFLLLFQNSAGSSYENFFDRLVNMEEKEILKYFNKMKEYNLKFNSLSQIEIHAIVSGQRQSIFEIIKHQKSKEKMIKSIDVLTVFFSNAWKQLLKP